MKPYQHVLIEECDEPLVPLPLGEFAVVTPHPYVALGAPYGDLSPYWVRQSVAIALHQAQQTLQTQHPGWQLQIFDAYRPLAVQQFMVDYTAQELAQQQGLNLAQISDAERQALMAQVYQFWALPSPNPKTPPPHSTGAAIDLSLVDETGQPIDMGSPIDEVSARSHPDHFQHQMDAYSQQVHRHRVLLRQAMKAAGFEQHPNEWWHFSLGDQMWGWLKAKSTGQAAIARYGSMVPED
ncbi:M15 family metallopeptidase [Leptolyngbya iicbica]|uniref:D-alanyl-D-alanine dipeptidase n=2 Tax=Cyanophyceae TaxID=3028117 RepID=A0A4Q7E8G6_9CYAN|nr:M15 family metallopeptidase [Leptolyngbya sp. LK]RZM78892.1 D-alanyl-D-alanine dipeptidase [Leptolyngbya sp. LK]